MHIRPKPLCLNQSVTNATAREALPLSGECSTASTANVDAEIDGAIRVGVRIVNKRRCMCDSGYSSFLYKAKNTPARGTSRGILLLKARIDVAFQSFFSAA